MTFWYKEGVRIAEMIEQTHSCLQIFDQAFDEIIVTVYKNINQSEIQETSVLYH